MYVYRGLLLDHPVDLLCCSEKPLVMMTKSLALALKA